MSTLSSFIPLVILVFILWWKNKKSSHKDKPKETYNQNLNEMKHTKSKFCSECGAQLEQNDLFCPICGEKVAELYDPTRKKYPTKRKP